MSATTEINPRWIAFFEQVFALIDAIDERTAADALQANPEATNGKAETPRPEPVTFADMVRHITSNGKHPGAAQGNGLHHIK